MRWAATNCSAIIELLVTDAAALLETLRAEVGGDFSVVQAPTVMPWGDLSVLIRDAEGTLINLCTPVTAGARDLQADRTPTMSPSA